MHARPSDAAFLPASTGEPCHATPATRRAGGRRGRRSARPGRSAGGPSGLAGQPGAGRPLDTRQHVRWPGGRWPRWASACTSGTRCAGLVVQQE